MISASYTNRIRTTVQARNVKVEYPGRQANNYNALQSTLGCNPNYTKIKYTIPCCKLNK
jgi:hypothetical protein